MGLPDLCCVSAMYLGDTAVDFIKGRGAIGFIALRNSQSIILTASFWSTPG